MWTNLWIEHGKCAKNCGLTCGRNLWKSEQDCLEAETAAKSDFLHRLIMLK